MVQLVGKQGLAAADNVLLGVTRLLLLLLAPSLLLLLLLTGGWRTVKAAQ